MICAALSTNLNFVLPTWPENFVNKLTMTQNACTVCVIILDIGVKALLLDQTYIDTTEWSTQSMLQLFGNGFVNMPTFIFDTVSFYRNGFSGVVNY